MSTVEMRYKQQQKLAKSALSRPWTVLVSSTLRWKKRKNRERSSNSGPVERGRGCIEQLTYGPMAIWFVCMPVCVCVRVRTCVCEKRVKEREGGRDRALLCLYTANIAMEIFCFRISQLKLNVITKML